MEILVSAAGRLAWGERTYRCALGRGGVSGAKREGDGATPRGVFPLRCLYYRADRLERPSTALPARALEPRDGWCDDPADPHYNRLVTLPHPARSEALWREDGLYDLIVPLGYNDDPVVPGRGSAVFLHVARPDFGPTEGCIAVARAPLLEILAHCGPEARLRVQA